MEGSNRTVGQNVRKLRGKRSLAKVSRETGIPDRYLSLIEKGNANITVKTQQRLADYFGVSIVELFGYESKPRPICEHKLIISEKPIYGEKVENFMPIPLLSDPASLGPGLEIDHTKIEGTCLIHRRVLKKTGEYQAIFVKGDSMAPILNDGDIVAIDVTERNPDKLKGKLVACHTGDYHVSIKSLRTLNEKFYLKAFNSDWEDENGPMLTPKKDGLILGKVVWAWKKFE